MKATACVILMCVCAFHVFASTATDIAASQNRKAHDRYVEVSKKADSERAALLGEIETLRLRLSDLSGKLRSARDESANIMACDKKLDFNSRISRRICADASAAAPALKAPIMPTGEEAAAFAKSAFMEFARELFEPDAPRVSSARISANETVEGRSFRIGSTTYFVSENCCGFMLADGRLYGRAFSDDIDAFCNGKSKVLPLDATGGTLAETETLARGFSEDMRRGGIWMWPIMFFGFLSIIICALKIARFSRIKRAPKDALAKIFESLDRGDEPHALKYVEKLGFPYAGFLSSLIKSRNLNSGMLEEVSYEYMLVAGEKLFGKLSVLSVTAAVAPLFGLLGTVTGIIKTFGDLSAVGAQHARLISSGISEALITTEYGLIVAIPAFVAHALLSRRAKSVLADMEKLAAGFIGRNSNGK